jgi:hypothetical protein
MSKSRAGAKRPLLFSLAKAREIVACFAKTTDNFFSADGLVIVIDRARTCRTA